VLLDFGIACDISDDPGTTTVEGRVRGTPAYMAPERFFGAPASVRSDVYELGVVLYTMLVGRLPWGSEKNVTERLNPTSPREAGADISSSLATVILRALSTRPEMRPASAEELACEVSASRAGASSASRHTVDVEIETAPAVDRSEMAYRATEALPSIAPSVTTPPARPTKPALTIVALLGLIVAGAIGMRAMRAAPAEAGSAAGPGTPAPTACAAAEIHPNAPPRATSAAPSLVAALPGEPSSVSSPGAKAASAHVSTRSPPPSSTKPSPAPSADPARYFEDRR